MASTAESAMPTRVVGGVYPAARVFAPSAAGGGKAPWQAVILGSATSGIVEQFLFHPVDTVAKRLMSDKSSGAVSLA